MTANVPPAPLDALVRHFADLRDGTHAGQATRQGKESAFRQAAGLLDAPARQVLAEFDRHLLLGAGTIEATGPRADAAGGSFATWSLSWPAQRAAGIAPITLTAHYGAGFRGADQGDLLAGDVHVGEQVEGFRTRLPWVSTAPLGRPVVPEVWRIRAGSSRVTGTSIGSAPSPDVCGASAAMRVTGRLATAAACSGA
jgi:hypothetical protein